MDANNICFSCTCELLDADTIICKGFCRSSFHMKCVNQDSDIRDRVKSTSQLFWMCEGCTEMMLNANFRQTIVSTNTVIQLVREEHNQVLEELRNGIKQNSDKINSLLQVNTMTDGSSQSNNTSFAAPQITRKRRRLQEAEDTTSNHDAVSVNKTEGTKEVDAAVVVPLAAPREKKFYLYLSGFAPEATVNEISDLVMKNLNCTNETVDVAKLVPKGKNLCELTFVSFKVGIGLHLKDLALQSSSWQKGIVFREFDSNQSAKRTGFRPPTIPASDSLRQ